MAILPISVARVPTLLSSRVVTSNLNRTNLDLLNLQTQLTTGRQVNRSSDDPVRASVISVVDNRLRAIDQQKRNLTHASTVLNSLDDAIGGAGGLQDRVRSALSIASGQIDSDAVGRAAQIVNVDSIISSIFATANGEFDGVHYFGGSTPGTAPLVEFGGGYRYVGRGSGLLTDLGLGQDIPITIGGDNAVGETSARLRSTLDLDPGLTSGTKLRDLSGARGLGVATGVVRFQFGAGPQAEVDLSQAQTIGDVATRLTAAVRQYETDNGVTVLGPGGIAVSGGSLQINIAAGGSLALSDITGGTTAADLGLTTAPFTPVSALGGDLRPRLTLETPLSAIASLPSPLGQIRIRQSSGQGSTFRDVDLSSATTIDEVRNLIEASGQGVRVSINDAGTGINVYNEVSGRRLSIEEVAGGANTASQLGIRSLDFSTATADFNGGRGVGIIDGVTDPVTGTVSATLNTDFRVTLGNGQFFDVDLRPQDMATVQTVIDRINAAAATAVTAGSIPAGSFNATLGDGPNGFVFQDLTSLGTMKIDRLNNSAAAEDLGLVGGTYDATSATFVGTDRAGVRINNLLSDLIDLRDALNASDRNGISIAGERLQQSGDRLLAAHALVGTYGQRVNDATDRVEEREVLDRSIRSNLQDLDYTEASVRFNQLQNQLTASLQSAAAISQRSLLDFLR